MNNHTAEQAIPVTLSQSERHILGLMFRGGPATQSELLDQMELTQQSVSRLVGGLMTRGLIAAGKRQSNGKRGYPTTQIHLEPAFAQSAGVSINADSIAFAVVDFSGSKRFERRVITDNMSIDAVMRWVEHQFAVYAADPVCRHSRFVGLGIAVAGSFVGDGVGFNTPRYLDDWANIDVAALFEQRFGLTSLAENNGNAAALAESIVGIGKAAKSFAYLYLGAGVGGGIVLDRQLWRGRCGNAGEFAGGLPPNIYPFPNLELLRQLVARSGHNFETVEDLVEHFDPAWPENETWIERVRDSVSIIASNASAILDLEAIVLGGRIPKLLAERLIPTVEFFDQRRRAQLRPTARLVPSEVDGEATAIGAAMLPLLSSYF